MVQATKPTIGEIIDIGTALGAHYSDEDAAFISEIITPLVVNAGQVLSMPDYLPEVKYPRTIGYRPEGNENPLNAWYYKSEIKGAPEGPLAGKTVALKDNVLLAGVPCMNGASVLQQYVPEVDATVVTRLLDAGATILGKAHCEYFCLSGSSYTSDIAPVENARKPGYSAGGSSSGSAALVAAGEVDMAVGGDQGGSIRMPASFCGIVGLKPTHGLVPYTGIMSMEVSIDHTGPMTANVADNALMLETLAGEDGWDIRQRNVVTHPYTTFVDKGVEGMRIGILKEGFGRPESDPEVDEKVRTAAAKFAELGAVVEEVSVPMHDEIAVIFLPMIAEGMVRQLTFGAGLGSGLAGFYPPSLLHKNQDNGLRADEFPDTVKALSTLGTYVMNKWGGRIYARGQNMRPWFVKRYADVFETYDLLLMPTTAMPAVKLPEADWSRQQVIERAWCMLGNTMPYDYTGHPAISIPCGMTSEGLPVGLQLVATHFNEPAIYKAAGAFEASTDWMTP
ncbi:amidase [Microbaculum marinum]|uniref:Indoleacetamide hydrolase n=1 Tax=Microbaculum marinum TaxID=1764581 RepID=A0AAW9RN69_9HYPH